MALVSPFEGHVACRNSPLTGPPFRDVLSFVIKSISLIRQSYLLEQAREIVLKDKEVRSSYVRSHNVYKLMTFFVCVHQRVRGSDRECNQHILHHTGYIEIYKLGIVG